MKTLFVLVTLSLFTSSFSQHKVSLGLRAGMNVSNFTNSELEPKTGPYFAGFVQFKVSDYYAFQPEFGYSNQGGRSKDIETKTLKVDYFTISIINQLYLKNSGFHFIVFPSIEYDFDNSKFNESDEKNGVTGLDLALGAGIGYEFKFGLVIETRFKHGLIDTNIQLFDNNDVDQYNIVFQLGASYKFKIK